MSRLPIEMPSLIGARETRPVVGPAPTRLARLLLGAGLVGAGLSLGIPAASAQDATWNNPATVAGPTPGTFDFDAAANWNPNAVPTGTAFFNASITPNLSFSSPTTIGGWTFNAGASAYTFTNNLVLDFTGAGIVINGGSASLNGTGSINFRNASTAGSASFSRLAAFLIFYDSSNAGHATISLNNSLLGFDNTASAANASIVTTFASALQFSNSATGGNAGITLNSSAHLNFLDTSTAGGATIAINNVSAVVQFANASTAGNARITNSTGSVGFIDTSTAGNASITNNNFMTFDIASTAGSATITNNGNIGFFGSSTAGSATITTTALGATFFAANATGGTARFITNAGGVLDFSASSGPNNDHKLTAGSLEGAGSTYLGANQLSVGGNNLSTTVSGVISDCGPTGSRCFGAPATGGSLVKTGSGTLGLGGTNTYTGPTTVNGGTLSVNGSIASSSLTTVNAGATLGGNGTVGTTRVNGGTLSPGNSIGTLAVQGSLAFTTAASYMVEVSAASADRTNVSGNATLAGAVRVTSPTGSYRFNSPYTILTSSGLGGTQFNALATPAGITGSLIYSGGNVLLNLASGLGQLPGLNGNQRAVAAAFDAAINAQGGNAGTPAGLFAGNVAQNLTQASGESATGSQQATFDAMNLFMGLLTDPFVAGRGDPLAASPAASSFAADGDAAGDRRGGGAEREAYAAVYRKAPAMADPFAQRWSVWAAGFGGSQTTDGNAAVGSNTATSRVFGTAVGADYRFSPFTLAGFALAGGGTNFSVNGLGSGRSDLFQAAAFLRHTVGLAYLSAALAYGWQDITTDRTVTIAGVDQLRARFNANAFSGRIEGGYRLVAPWVGGVGITPYAAGQFTTFDLPAYAESVVSGVNTFALAYGSKSATASRSELGVRTDKSWAVHDGILTLRGRFAWAHDFNTDRSIAATFQTLPGASFVVNGAAASDDAALTTAALEMKWLNGVSVAATFEGEFSDVTRSYAGKGVARYAW